MVTFSFSDKAKPSTVTYLQILDNLMTLILVLPLGFHSFEFAFCLYDRVDYKIQMFILLWFCWYEHDIFAACTCRALANVVANGGGDHRWRFMMASSSGSPFYRSPFTLFVYLSDFKMVTYPLGDFTFNQNNHLII